MDNTIGSPLDRLYEVLHAARKEVAKVIIGQDDVVDRALIVIFTNHHALVEGVPGIAKTLLVRTLAHVLGCEFNRIQFTPDLMPADIIGTNIFNLKTDEFTLVKGPVFTTFLLADEINRAPAKTQSALLQAMQERMVTIDRVTYPLPDNFTVFATQNPIEYEGTYPLPEAQKDRFMLKITMDYPAREDELTLAQRMLGKDSPETVLALGSVKPVVSMEELERPPGLSRKHHRQERDHGLSRRYHPHYPYPRERPRRRRAACNTGPAPRRSGSCRYQWQRLCHP